MWRLLLGGVVLPCIRSSSRFSISSNSNSSLRVTITRMGVAAVVIISMEGEEEREEGITAVGLIAVAGIGDAAVGRTGRLHNFTK